ncbi:hypothetical protein ACIGKQ_16500 [Gordonia sp. NPDC062954]|uniref:hypothetical protein n=1 Tax=unclassified Gordonia (in: high G+C Gram-positive bacteria) TaxID=2657482 RepID=UPI000C3B65ED|nr:hypothetical protein [Gordonia sp. (in: high G+C Gram-positive bacteria)]MAU83396.1 hypothetical protein [Gordonia sp. (in: high G+C Gram-positive bacteria)]
MSNWIAGAEGFARRAIWEGYLGPVQVFYDFMLTLQGLPGWPPLEDVVAEESLTDFVVRRDETLAAIDRREVAIPPVFEAPGVAYLLLRAEDVEDNSVVTLVRRPHIADSRTAHDHWRVLAVGELVEAEDIAIA